MKSVIFLGLFMCVSSLSSYGSDFIIGAPRNLRGRTALLYLYIMTPSSCPVGVTVEDYNGTIATGSVSNVNWMKLNLSSNLVTVSNNYDNRYKGIRVRTDGNVISVLLFSYQISNSGEYVAYPIQQTFDATQYHYYVVSTEATTVAYSFTLSEALLVGTNDNTTVTVIPTKNIAVPQNIQLPSSSNVTITAGTPFSFILHRMQTFLFGAPQYDITGSSITSDKPLTVISGHECGNAPNTRYNCQHFTVQIPPTAEWGKQFLLTPYSDKFIQYYKIIATENQTTFNFTCGSAINTFSLRAGNSHTLSTGANDYCSIFSDKPILVNQLAPGYSIGYLGDVVISLIPSISQLSTEAIAFVTPDQFTSHYINIIAISQDTVLLDGTPLSLDWNAIYDSTRSVIGYGAQVQVNASNSSRIITTSSDNKLYLLVYGFGNNQAYSYSIGYNSLQKGSIASPGGVSIMPIYTYDTITLICSAVGATDYQWTDLSTGEIISNDCITTGKMSGQYKCTAINRAGNNTAIIKGMGSLACE